MCEVKRSIVHAVAAVALALLAACEPYTTVMLSADYRLSKRPLQLSCGVAIQHAVRINYSGSVVDEFGPGDTETAIERFFNAQLLHDIQKRTLFDTAWHVRLQDNYRRSPRQVDVPHMGTVTFQVPTQGEVLLVDGSQPKFVLILERMAISSAQEVTIRFGGRWGPRSFESDKDLVFEGRFILWDNTVGRLVSLGYVMAVDENAYAVSLEDWHAAMGDFVTQVFRGTPLTRTGP